MSCIEHFIPRTKLEERLAKEFGLNNKERDTMLAMAKSDSFKKWYKNREGKDFNEDGDGRHTYPALRRYYNNKFFDVNKNTTIRNDKGRFTSYNARQEAIDATIKIFNDDYFKGSVEIDTNPYMEDENGELIPNPHFGKTKNHRFATKEALANDVYLKILYRTKDKMDNIIVNSLPQSMINDFNRLLEIEDFNLFEEGNNEKIYQMILDKYNRQNQTKSIKIQDAYDLAAVFSDNETVRKALRDRYVKKMADPDMAFVYDDIFEKILTNKQIATVQDQNHFAWYNEVRDGVESEFFQEVYDDGRMSGINKMGIETDDDEYLDPNLNPGEGDPAETKDAQPTAEMDNTIKEANNHMGVFDSFMKHADSVIRAYLGSLSNIDSVDDINSFDLNNELGVETAMNVSEVMTVLYTHIDKTSPMAMRESIIRIARDIPGMKGLAKIYQDTNPTDEVNLDLLYRLYSTFAKTPVSRSQVLHNSQGVEVKIANKRTNRLDSLRLDMLNEFRSTGVSINDEMLKADLEEIENKINKFNGSVEQRLAINSELNDFLAKIFPSLTRGTVVSFTTKDGVDNYKANAQQLVAGIKSTVEDIFNLQAEYNSLRAAQQDVYSELSKIKYKLDNFRNLQPKQKKELIEQRIELKKKLAELYAKDYTSSSQSSVYNLAALVADHTLVRSELNVHNIHGDMSSAVINNSMITNIINTLQNSNALKKFGDYKFQSRQYDKSNILMEKIDEDGNIINYGLFRFEEEVDTETGEIKKYPVPTEYARDLLALELFDGVKNTDSGNAALYSQMSKNDYKATAFNEFFNDEVVFNGNIHTARYFTRIPSDATNIFVVRGAKYHWDPTIDPKSNPLFKQVRAMFEQELADAANALGKFFEIRNGKVVVDDNKYIPGTKTPNPNFNKPKFKNGWSDNTEDARRAYDLYHVKSDKSGRIYFLESREDGKYKLAGNVFHSDRFVISTTQRNYGEELLSNGTIDFLYGGGKEGIELTQNENNVSYRLSKQQEEAVDNMVLEFINDYLEDSRKRLEGIQGLNEDHNNKSDIDDFHLNTFVMYGNFNDLLEGDTKFYKDAQTSLKRAKEMEGSGTPYGITNYVDSLIPDMSHIPSRLDKVNISIEGREPITLRNGFRAVTIKNTIRTSEESNRLFGWEEETKDAYGKKKVIWHKGALENRNILTEESAKRLKKLYKNTKVNDAQSYITLDEWIRRITARGQYARYENLIKKLIDSNAELNDSDIDEFVQVQKNFYYDQHYNSDLGVMAPRQIKNAEFVLIPKFIKGSELETVYNLMIKNKIDQLNTAETSKAGKANVLTLWDNDGNLKQENIDDFEREVGKDKTQAVEIFSYNNLYSQQDIPQHMHSENKAGIQIMKKILDNIAEEYAQDGEPKGLYKKKMDLLEAYNLNIKESFTKLMDKLGVPLDENGIPELEYVTDGTGTNAVGHWQIKGLSYEKLFKRLKEEARRTGVNSNTAEFFELGRNGEPLLPPFMSNVSTKLESIIQAMFNSNITRQKLPGSHGAQVTGVGIANLIKMKAQSDVSNNPLNPSTNQLRYHPIVNGELQAYTEVLIAKPKEYEGLSDKEALEKMEFNGMDKFIIYRIPTEGKQSVSVAKVAGFTDKSQGSTIIVADDWISQTGADMDGDSIYSIEYTPTHGRDYDYDVEVGMDTRTKRNNLIVRNMIEILSDPRSMEENLSCSNFVDIIEARDEILEGTDVAAIKSHRSPYSFHDQADFQEDAVSGLALKGMSVTRDNFCSICNTVKPIVTRPLIVRYNEFDETKNPRGKRYEDLVAAYGDNVKVITKADGRRIFEVKHDKFGWSENNKNVNGRLVTAYSSQTTAHILDAIKEGNIPNVNTLTFGIYKMFPDLGCDYRTAVSFMMTPGVTRIVDAYNKNKSIYAKNNPNRKNDNRQFVIDVVKDIAKELGVVVDGEVVNEFTPYPDVLKALDERYGKYIGNAFNVTGFSFVNNSKTDRFIYFNSDLNIQRFKKTGYFATPVGRTITLGSANFTMTSGGALGSDYYFGTVASRYNVSQRHFYHGQRSQLNAPYGNEEISEADYNEGKRKVAAAAARDFGYQFSVMKDDRLVRNWAQVKYADSIFAVGEIAQIGDKLFPNQRNDERVAINPSVKGGTGYAVGMAINEGKPVFVFDQNKNQWFKYDYNINNFVETSDVVLTPKFAGIGTREINENGKRAIEELFRNTFENHKDDQITINDNKVNINERRLVYDLLTVFQYQYLANSAQKTGDCARVMNLDKFGAKVTSHATRKTINDIRTLVSQRDPMFIVQHIPTEEEITRTMEQYNNSIDDSIDSDRFDTIENSLKIINSGRTILSNEELSYWNEQGIVTPRIMVASEHTDPAFHSKKIIDIIEGRRKAVDYKGNELSAHDFNGLYIITKHDGLPIRQILQTNIPKLIHFSITSLGGTKYEPGVMKYHDLLDRIQDLIDQGLDPNSVTVRIDPIVPGITNFDDVEEIIHRSSKMGITRIRFSVMDNYPENRRKGTKSTENYFKEIGGYDFEKYYNKSIPFSKEKDAWNANSIYQKHAKPEVQKEIAEKMLALASKYNVTLGSCAEPVIIPGVNKEGCLSVDAVNKMLGTSIEDRGTDNNKSRKECSCFGGKTDVLQYDETCPSHCVYCYAGHNTNTAINYYNEDGTLKNNIFTRTRSENDKRKKVDINSPRDREAFKSQLTGARKNMISAVYPGVQGIPETEDKQAYIDPYTNEPVYLDNKADNEWIDSYMKNTEKSAYPTLNSFFKMATIPSILVEEQVFATESPYFVTYVNNLGKVLGRNISEKEYGDFKRYLLAQVYKDTEFLQEDGTYGSINNSDSIERISGINMPITFNLHVEDIMDPKDEEKEAFKKLTPAQKVLWIKQNAKDAGIFNYLDVNLRNNNKAENYSSTQEITFKADAIEEEAALAGMRKAWKNKIWFVKETVRDLFKYSIAVENMVRSKRGVTKLIVNSVLLDTNFTREVTSNVKLNVGFNNESYLNYIRGHAEALNIPTFESKGQLETSSDTNHILVFDLMNKKDRGYKTRIVRNPKHPSIQPFIRVVSDNGNNTLYMGYNLDSHAIYVPLNKLMPSESSEFSIRKSENLYPRLNFYEEFINYIVRQYYTMGKVSAQIEEEIKKFDKTDYVFKDNQVNQVQEYNLNEHTDSYEIQGIIKTIADNHSTIQRKGYYIRSGILADVRPGTELGAPDSYLPYMSESGSNEGAQYLIKHIDANNKRGTYSINDLLTIAKSAVNNAKENGLSYNINQIADHIINVYMTKEDDNIKSIVRKAIERESSRISDLFMVVPKVQGMASSVGELSTAVGQGVIGMSNRRAIGDENAAMTLYEMDQSGINPEDVDSVVNNITPTIKYLNSYTKLVSNNLLESLSKFYKDSDGVWHGVDDENIVKYLAENPNEFKRLLNLLADIKSFTSELNFINSNGIDVEKEDDENKELLKEINQNINKVKVDTLTHKAYNAVLDYLKTQSDDPLIVSELFELTDGFHNIGKVENLFTDAQEAPIPLMQVILHIATSNVRGEDIKHLRNARKFRKKIDDLIATGRVNLDKFIDENGKIIQPFNNLLVEDNERFKNELDELVKAGKKDSKEYIRKLNEYKKFRLANFHQRLVDDYYKEMLAIEDAMIDPDNGFIGLLEEYIKLSHRRADILSHNVNGELNEDQKNELVDIQEKLDELTSTDGREYIYNLVGDLERSAYTEEDWEKVNHSYEAARALDIYVKRMAAIKDKYFNKTEKDAFRETLKQKLQTIFEYENPDGNGDPQTPASRLEHNSEYQAAKRWIEINSQLTTTPEFSKMLEEAYKTLGIGHKGTGFKILQKIKAKHARDQFNIVDGTKFTDDEIDEIKQDQLDDYQLGSLNGFDYGHIIQNGAPSPFIWKQEFWTRMTTVGKSNPEYILLVNKINNILNKVYDSNTKQVNFTKVYTNGTRALSLDDLRALADYYDLIKETSVKFDTINGKTVHDFIEKFVDTTISPEMQARYNEEKTNAEALYGKDSEEMQLWHRINDSIENHTIGGVTTVKVVPNRFLYGGVKPKNAVGVINRDSDGVITAISGNASFMNWIDIEKTKANDTIKRFISNTPSKYYYDTKKEVYKERTGETPVERMNRINEWERRNHIYNPYTHTIEPIKIWMQTNYKGGNIGLAAATGTSSGIYSYEPRFAQMESEPKKEYDNLDKGVYKQGSIYSNFKNTNPIYKNDKLNDLTDEEKQVKEEFENILKAYAKSSSAKRYIEDGSMPAKYKPRPHDLKWHMKQALHSFGWYYAPHTFEDTNSSVDFEHDYVPKTPGLKQLIGDGYKKKEHLPKRSNFGTTPEETAKYEAEKRRIEELNKEIEENNAKIHKDLLNRDWVSIMEQFIMEAGHHNAVQENKNLIYFGIDYLKEHDVYRHNAGKSNLKVDKHASFGNNVNYEKEGYGDATLAVYEAFARRFIFNQFKKDQEALTKIANVLQQMSSAKYMMINVTGGISNVTYGETQIAMEAFANEYFSAAEWGVGKRLWLNSLGSFGTHLYDDKASDIGDALCKFFNTLEFDSITELREDNPGATVKWQRVRNAAYVLQTLGEHFMQNGALLTMLSSNRLVEITDKVTGKKRYVAWSLSRYLRDAREQAMMEVIDNPDDFKEFISKIKDDPNDLKDYAWRRKDPIHQYLLRLPKDVQKRFAERKNQLEKEAEEKFKTLPTLFDQFKLEDGYADFKDDSIFNTLTEEETYRILGELKNKVISVNKKIHGVYDKLGASRLEQEWYGGLVMQYHKHIWPGIMKRWRMQGYYNEDRQTTEKGMYTSLFDFLSIPFHNMKDIPEDSRENMSGIQNFFKQMTEFLLNIKLNYQLMSSYDQANIRRCLAEMCAYASAVALAVAIKLGADDDDEKDGIPYNLMIYTADRLATESIMYTPWGLVGEAKTLWSSPVAAEGAVGDLLQSINVISQVLLQGDEYDPNYKSGLYAGQNKIKVLVTRNIPIYRSLNQVWRLPKNNKYYKRQSNGSNQISDYVVRLIQD